ncbi:restriction endonuclease subunit S [Pectobacterium polaris]|uniref:restriction endonuclease subunit S n=1 Tax=Pectobacterium polaris TaxID=2042057 RepID=UPI000E710BE8|nr:restriction endonuclease subunit S [Pectobacterium polaris]RJL23784.1 restriction endonuclease subunit S [Pectobacterium polaris]
MSVDNKVPEIRIKNFSGKWYEVALSSVIDVRSGKDYKHLGKGNIPVYGTGGYMLSVDSALSSDEDAIGIGRKGTIDKPYILRAPFWTVDTLFYAVPFSNFNLNFLFCLFQKINWKKYDESTGVPSLSKIAINNVPVYATSQLEQVTIGNYFQKLDTLINQHQQKHDKLNSIKKAMLEKMFPKKDETIPEIRFKGFSGEWDEISLLDSIERIIDFRGRTPKKLGLDWSPAGYRALSALNVKQGYIDFSIDPHFGDQELYDKWMSGSELHQGQVLFTTEAPMGNVAQVPNTDKYILSQRTIAFITKSEIIAEDFLAVLLRSSKVFRELSALSSGGTAKGVSQKVLANLNVSIPTDLVEQAAIGNYFQKLDSLINKHQQQIIKLNNIKQACLSKMFV